MEKKTDAVKVEVVIVHQPHYVGKMRCPKCNANQWDYLDKSEANKILLHYCRSCDEDFYIDIPNFTQLKLKHENSKITD